MLRRLMIFVVMLFLFVTNLYSQDKYEYFSDELLTTPFKANFLEPKLGAIFMTDNNKLRLEISNSIDFLRVNIDNNTKIAFGADLFTYTLLRQEKDFHFPVEAVDYLFGLNFSYKKILNENNFYGLRFRFSHISAHLVDGRFNKENNAWLENQLPEVYSREFFEIMPYYSYKNFRTYLGLTYLYHTDPSWVGKYIYQIGFDYHLENRLPYSLNPYIAYDLRINKIKDYKYNSSFDVGIKIGKWNDKGLSIYYRYYNGNSIHGEFFTKEDNYSAIGFNLDL